jgi:hypothetical protein
VLLAYWLLWTDYRAVIEHLLRCRVHKGRNWRKEVVVVSPSEMTKATRTRRVEPPKQSDRPGPRAGSGKSSVSRPPMHQITGHVRTEHNPLYSYALGFTLRSIYGGVYEDVLKIPLISFDRGRGITSSPGRGLPLS